MFPNAPMHQCFLGILKGNLKQSQRLKLNYGAEVGRWWALIHATIVERQESFSKLSIDWCNLMPFTGTEKDKKVLGTSGWQSSHSHAFARISLVQLAVLDKKSKAKLSNKNKSAIEANERFVVLLRKQCLCR